MRIILSQGKVNILNLAKNAGTSVEQIERFYPRHLPLSAEIRGTCRSSEGRDESSFHGAGLLGSEAAKRWYVRYRNIDAACWERDFPHTIPFAHEARETLVGL